MSKTSSLPDLIGFKCQRCGKCCLWGGLSLSASKIDVERWELGGREDILQFIDFITVKVCPKCGRGTPPEKEICGTCGVRLEWKPVAADLWFDPITGEELSRSPFLRKARNKNEYRCRIHDTKPNRCRNFPIAVSAECETCGLNFVRYFRDTKFQDIPLEEYLNWTEDDFFIKLLKDVKNCPQCGEPIFGFQEWAIENCPGTQLFLKKRV